MSTLFFVAIFQCIASLCKQSPIALGGSAVYSVFDAVLDAYAHVLYGTCYTLCHMEIVDTDKFHEGSDPGVWTAPDNLSHSVSHCQQRDALRVFLCTNAIFLACQLMSQRRSALMSDTRMPSTPARSAGTVNHGFCVRAATHATMPFVIWVLGTKYRRGLVVAQLR